MRGEEWLRRMSEEQKSALIQKCDRFIDQIDDKSLPHWDDYCDAFEELVTEICGDFIYESLAIWKGRVSMDELAGMTSELQEVLKGNIPPFWDVWMNPDDED